MFCMLPFAHVPKEKGTVIMQICMNYIVLQYIYIQRRGSDRKGRRVIGGTDANVNVISTLCTSHSQIKWCCGSRTFSLDCAFSNLTRYVLVQCVHQ